MNFAEDFVQLSNLKPATIYTVQVESRKECQRADTIKNVDNNDDYKYTVFSKSNIMQFQTAGPPDPPTNLSVVSTTCHSVKICWDPPIDHGSDLIGTKKDFI